MVTPESIEDNIRQGMSTAYLNVDGDGRDFEAVVVSEEFEGMSRIQRHQRAYKTLGDRMREEVHALSMRPIRPRNGKTGANKTSYRR